LRHTSEGPLVLRHTKRYAHAPHAVEALCRDAGFRTCTIEPLDLRLDRDGKPIAGFLVVAEK
jgi:predicted TPR repeat methyltransferase